MSTKRKLPPHEAWDVLEKMALHDEAERVTSLSDAELDRELQEKGFDPKALRERGAALAEKLRAASVAPRVPQTPVKPAAPQARVKRTLPTRARWAALAAATMAALGAAVAIPTAVVSVGNGGAQHALELRRGALGACQEARWLECQQGLDAARKLDPASEDLPEVKAAREKIAAELHLPKETR